MNYQEIQQAMDESSTVIRESENLAIRALEFSEGRLERLNKRRYPSYISSRTLSALKRELRRWDITLNKWK